jgi:hypothetical protein
MRRRRDRLAFLHDAGLAANQVETASSSFIIVWSAQ